jgi:hypothetical protein
VSQSAAKKPPSTSLKGSTFAPRSSSQKTVLSEDLEYSASTPDRVLDIWSELLRQGSNRVPWVRGRGRKPTHLILRVPGLRFSTKRVSICVMMVWGSCERRASSKLGKFRKRKRMFGPMTHSMGEFSPSTFPRSCVKLDTKEKTKRDSQRSLG